MAQPTSVHLMGRPLRALRALIPAVVAAAIMLPLAAGMAMSPAERGGAALVIVVVLLIWFGLRAWLWRRGPASTELHAEAAGLRLLVGGREMVVPWADIRQINFLTVDRYPEWSRVASFPTFDVLAEDSVSITAPLLISSTEGGVAAEEVRAMARFHGVTFT